MSSESQDPLVDPEAEIIDPSKDKMRQKVSKRAIATLLILVYINLLNYMDRFTVSSVLPDIQKWFGGIGQKKAGLLQTVFVVAYMVFAPVFGYLGDRFPRKYVMAVGITIWSATTFACSLMGKTHFWGFFALRGLVGIGEASYSTVAPTIIADLFVGDNRSKALSFFYFAIPCGSGLGYVVGSKVASLFHGPDKWQWALRVTPVLGVVAVILTLIAVHEPKRGALETGANQDDRVDGELSESVALVQEHSYIEDLKKIFKVKSFIWSTIGYTCVSFTIGALAWWAPEFGLYSIRLKDNPKEVIENVSYKFGIVTFVSGVIGVTAGAEMARRWRRRNFQADALVCALGMLGGIPFLFLTLYLFDKQQTFAWVLMAIGEIFLFLNWAPNGDILLYVMPPSVRSSAEAVQIVLLHTLGDAFSPFILGAIADAYVGKNKDHLTDHEKLANQQRGLLYALYVTPFVCIIGAWAYIIAGRHLEADKKAADAEALNEADIPPSSALDQMPPAPSADNSSGGGSSNPPVNRIVVHDIYDHIQNQESDSDDSYEEDNEDRRQLIQQPQKVNKRTERIV
ncbi:protein spinster homolog 1-like [Clytia hemisphaerica]